MFNSRIIVSDFAYEAPESLGSALLALRKPGVKALAGGTDLLNRLRDGRDTPAIVVYLGRVPELTAIETGDGFLRIGAALPMTALERFLAARAGGGASGSGAAGAAAIGRSGHGADLAALAEAVNSVGGTQVRNTATLGGNIGNASPGADSPPAIIVLGGEIESARADARGSVLTRKTPAEKFFTGPGRTILEPGEIVTAVILPLGGGDRKGEGRGREGGAAGSNGGAGTASAFRKIARVTLDIAKANCAVWLRREGEVISEIRIALGSVAPVPIRAGNAERTLKGKSFDSGLVAQAASEAAREAAPITDVRSTEGYRREIVSVLVADMVTEAYRRSGGKI
jgi:CO/xanthine dehydrogenase FAD-binding subunit